MPSITALSAKVEYDDSEVTRGVPRTQGHLQSFAQAVGGVGQVAGLAFAGIGIAGVAMAGGIATSVNAAADFQQNMAGVGALLGATDTEMQLLSDTALKLGQDTTLSGVGAKEAALAMQELAASGFNAGDIAAGAARGVLLLASATGTDIPTAAQIAGDSFNVFRQSMGLAASDMPMIADLFAGAANASSISLEDIGNAMQYVGPVAASMGISIQDVTATIADLGNQGIKGSGAGTALRSMLVSLASPSKEAAGTIKDLGLQFFDSEGHIKNFAGISEELKTKLAGLTDQQRANALATIFGKEALSAATVLYGDGAAGIQKYLDQITKTGVAADTGAIRNNTLRGSLASLQGAWETAQIALGQAFLPALKQLADFAANAVSAAIPLVQQWGPVLVGWLQMGIGVLMQWGGAIWGAASAVIGAFQSFTSGRTTLAQFIGGMEIFASTLVGKFTGLGAMIAPHIGAFFTTIANAVTTYGPQILAQLGIWAQRFGDWVIDAVPPLLGHMAVWYLTIEGWLLGTALPAIIGKLAEFAGAFVRWVRDDAIPRVQSQLPEWGSAIGDYITGTAIPGVVGFLAPLAQKFGTWVTETAIPYLQTNVPQWLSALGNWISGTAIPAVVGFVEPLAKKFGSWIAETAIPYLLENVPQWLAALVAWWYGTAIPKAGEFLIEMGKKFGEWVSETAVPYLQDNLPKWLITLGDYLRGTAIPAAESGLRAVGERFGTWVTETAVPWLMKHIPEWLDSLKGWLTGTALPAIGSTAHDLGQALVDKFMDAAGAIVGKVSAKMGEVPGAIRSGIGDLSGLLVNAGSSLIGGLISGITSKLGELRSTLGGITDSLPKWKGPADRDATILYDAGQLVLGGFIDGIEDKRTALQSALKRITEMTAITGESSFAVAVASNGGGNTANGANSGGRVVNINFNGPVYGSADFDRRVQQAKVALERQGAW